MLLSYSVYSLLLCIFFVYSVYSLYIYYQPQWHRRRVSPVQTHKIPNVSVNDSNDSNERFH